MKRKKNRPDGDDDTKARKLKRKDYEKRAHTSARRAGEAAGMGRPQGAKVCVVFEGRDGAGKGGTIKAITERVSPRVFRVVALPAPSDREKTQMYIQRYLQHLPAAGEIVIFDRSWYNRAGVERVMSSTEDAAREVPKQVPLVEKAMVDSGILLIKYWLEVSRKSRPGGSVSASTIHARSGSSRRWTSNPTAAGTTIHGRAMRCSPRPTPTSRPGSWRAPTTNGALA